MPRKVKSKSKSGTKRAAPMPPVRVSGPTPSALGALSDTKPDPLQFIRKRRLARLLDCSGDTLMRWVENGTMPAPMKLGSSQTIVWNLAVIQRWLTERAEKSGTDAA